MAEPSTQMEGSTVAAIVAVAGAIGAMLKPAFDWLIGRRKDRVSSEDLVRDDLMTQLKDQRLEIVQLHAELADARRELRDFIGVHQQVIREWQDRYNAVLTEMAELKAVVHGEEVSQKTRRPA